MRILIPGGTGLLGTLISKDLAGLGHDVVVLTRSLDTARLTYPSVRYLRWDGRSASGWQADLDGADAIINLAGESIGGTGTFQILFQRWTPEKKRRILESRVNAGRAIVDAVRAAHRKPQLLIQPVGIAYYGTSSTSEMDEASPPGDDFLAGVVQDWEASTAAVETMGVRRVLLRTGLVLSSRGGTLPMMMLPFRLWVGGPLGNGRQWVPWVHEQDLVAAVRFILGHPEASGPYNLVAPEAVTNRDFGRSIARHLRRPYWLPAPSLALRALLGEKATLVLDGQRAVPRRLLQEGFRFTFADLDAALADLLG